MENPETNENKDDFQEFYTPYRSLIAVQHSFTGSDQPGALLCRGVARRHF
jgi:hypothetical protein